MSVHPSYSVTKEHIKVQEVKLLLQDQQTITCKLLNKLHDTTCAQFDAKQGTYIHPIG